MFSIVVERALKETLESKHPCSLPVIGLKQVISRSIIDALVPAIHPSFDTLVTLHYRRIAFWRVEYLARLDELRDDIRSLGSMFLRK